MGIIKNVFGKKEQKPKPTDSELKAAVFKKATENMQAMDEVSASSDNVFNQDMPVYEINEQDKKKNIRLVLLEIVERGDAGVLATSISDKINISKIETSNALSFLTNNSLVEAINSPIGVKFYLTDAGKKHCISEEFNSDL
ncbi:MAG: hypothetical protein OEY78_03485 [Gammaproteobacteria bacterium]|nr:hypothetical protein [Gammaproteobacteria bacterium]